MDDDGLSTLLAPVVLAARWAMKSFGPTLNLPGLQGSCQAFPNTPNPPLSTHPTLDPGKSPLSGGDNPAKIWGGGALARRCQNRGGLLGFRHWPSRGRKVTADDRAPSRPNHPPPLSTFRCPLTSKPPEHSLPPPPSWENHQRTSVTPTTGWPRSRDGAPEVHSSCCSSMKVTTTYQQL